MNGLNHPRPRPANTGPSPAANLAFCINGGFFLKSTVLFNMYKYAGKVLEQVPERGHFRSALNGNLLKMLMLIHPSPAVSYLLRSFSSKLYSGSG